MNTPNYLENPKIKNLLNSRAFASEDYQGQLDDIDAFILGRQVRRELGIDSNHHYESPSEKFIAGRDDDPRWEFLSNFYERYNQGWWTEHREINETTYQAQLSDFVKHVKKSDLITGSVVSYQASGAKDKWVNVRIEFIHKDFSAVAVSLIDTKPEEMKLIGHKHGFGRFKKN